MSALAAGLGLIIGLVAIGVAIVAWLRVLGLSEQLRSLKRELKAINRGLSTLESRLDGEPSDSPRVEPPPLPKLQTASEQPKLTDDSVRTPRVPNRPRRELIDSPSVSTLDWEKFIGRRVLGWMAVGLILLAASFFIKYAFDNLFGPTARVATGATIGFGLCVLGARSGTRGNTTACSMFCSAGLLIIYLSLYASFGYYSLIRPETGGLFLSLIVIEGVLLSLWYRARPLAYLALAGALLVPAIVPANEDRYTALFIYLAIVNIVTAVLTRSIEHPVLQVLTYLGSQLLFWAWFAGHYHPEKMVAVLVVQSVFYGVWMLAGRFGRVRTNDGERVVMWLTTALSYFIFLLRIINEEAIEWSSILALSFALWYAVLTRFSLPSGDTIRIATLTTLSFGFLAIAIPMQTHVSWVPVSWGVIGTALWWFGLRIRQEPLLAGGFIFSVGSLLALFAVWGNVREETITIPIFNPLSLPVLGVAVCLLAIALVTRQFRDRLPNTNEIVRNTAALGSAFLVWVDLSWETLHTSTEIFLMTRTESQTALSVVWAMYAASLLAVGFWLDRRMIRWTGLGLFVFTVLKLLVYDLSELPAIERALTFLAAAVVAAAAAWGYQRFAHSMKEANHD